jgi:hypothetical protein
MDAAAYLYKKFRKVPCALVAKTETGEQEQPVLSVVPNLAIEAERRYVRSPVSADGSAVEERAGIVVRVLGGNGFIELLPNLKKHFLGHLECADVARFA